VVRSRGKREVQMPDDFLGISQWFMKKCEFGFVC
jgi:hypothetical protein